MVLQQDRPRFRPLLLTRTGLAGQKIAELRLLEELERAYAFGTAVGVVVFEIVDDRNRPDVAGSSRLSPHLHFGEISPRRLWHRVQTQMLAVGGDHLVRGVEQDNMLREVSEYLLESLGAVVFFVLLMGVTLGRVILRRIGYPDLPNEPQV